MEKSSLTRRIILVEKEYKGCNPDWSKTKDRVVLWEGSSIRERASIMRRNMEKDFIMRGNVDDGQKGSIMRRKFFCVKRFLLGEGRSILRRMFY